MKQTVLLILLFFAGFFTANAQITIKHDSVGKVETPPPSVNIQLYNQVYNNTSSDITLRWIRTVNTFPSNWSSGTSVCDENLCWGAMVSSKDVTLEANDSTNVDLYFYNGGRTGSGYAEVLVFDVADSANTVHTLKFYGEATNNVVSSITQLEGNKLNFYPNPVQSTLNVTSIENKDALVTIYNIFGREVLSQVLGNGIINTNDIEQGFYIVKVLDNDKKITYTNTFVKK